MFSFPDNEGHISDLKFDQWRAQELSPDQVGTLEVHLTDCERCRTRHQTLQAEAERFLQAHPTPEASKRAPAKLIRPRFRVMMGVWSAAIGLSAAGFLLWLRPSDSDSPNHSPTELSTRIKGSNRIGFFVKRGAAVTPGQDGQRIQPGDALRFTVSITAPTHFAILSLDGAGVASVYYPQGNQSQALSKARDLALDSSVTLDDSLGKEQVFGVFCEQAFELEPLRSTLEREARLSVPPSCSIDRLEILKVPP